MKLPYEHPLTLTALPVRTSDWLPDGALMRFPDAFYVGVRAESSVAHEARSIVRRGLRAELRWLGQPEMTGRELIEKIKRWETE